VRDDSSKYRGVGFICDLSGFTGLTKGVALENERKDGADGREMEGKEEGLERGLWVGGAN